MKWRIIIIVPILLGVWLAYSFEKPCLSGGGLPPPSDVKETHVRNCTCLGVLQLIYSGPTQRGITDSYVTEEKCIGLRLPINS